MRATSTLIITLLATTTAHADPQHDAEALAAQSKFVAAAAKYREAFALEHRPEQMCNVGVAYHKAADLPRAHRYLQRCLALGAGLDRAYMDTVAKVLASIEAQLASGRFAALEVSVEPANATIAIDGEMPFDEPLVAGEHVWFPIGDYRATISAEGFVTQQAALHATSRSTTERPRYVLDRAPTVSAPLVHTDVTPRHRASLAPPLVATGATLVAGVGALVLYAQMGDRAARANDATDPADVHRLRDEATSAMHGTWIAAGLASVGAVASGYLWYRWRTNHALAVDVQSGGRDGGATVTVGGTW